MNNKLYSILFVCTFLLIGIELMAQKTAAYSNQHFLYLEGVRLFDQGLYGPAQHHFQKYMDEVSPAQVERHDQLATQAALYIAKAAVRTNAPEAESLVLAFIQSHHPDPIATEATIEIANFYYADKNYEKAIAYYQMLQLSELTTEQAAEAKFKKGYSHFVIKEFELAKETLASVKDLRTSYYYTTNYYLGMTQFFSNDYPAAIRSFDRVSKSDAYKSFVPYYIAQIYFAQEEYEKVISTGTNSLDISKLQNKKEIHHLVGKAYFETGQYKQALPFLEYYESKSGKMRAEDFYQLGFVQYQMGMCEKAAENFKELRNQKTAMGQQAHYYMADCYLKAGDLTSARTALKSVSKMEFDPAIRDEAVFNYGKLSAEMNYDQEAIASLESVPASSTYYLESQEILKSLFINTRDYGHAIETLEKLPSLSPSLKEAYQKVAFSRAIQLLNDTDLDGASQLFDKSLKHTPNKSIEAQAYFWKGEIAHFNAKYDLSIENYQRYFTIARNASQIPVESSPAVAHYNQGYNYLKKQNYPKAQHHFKNAVSGFTSETLFAEESYIQNRVLADAILRTGDCTFKKNEYADAIRYYDQSIQQKKSGFVYAIYQKAIIKGLQGQVFDKIALLEEIPAQYPQNQFTDDALLELAITYQENGNAPRAVTTFEKITNKYNQTARIVIEAYLRLGLISYNNGDVQSALAYYQQIFERNPDLQVAKEAIAAIEEIYIRDLGQPDAYVAFVEALPGYNVSDFRKDSLSFIAAETKYENALYTPAIAGYSEYLTKYPNGVYRLNALYHRGESYSIQKEYANALQDYEMVIGLGQSSFYEQSLSKAAKICYNDAQDFQKSLAYYQQLEPVASTNEMIFEAQLGALRSAYRLNKTDIMADLATNVIQNERASESNKATAHFYRGKISFDQQSFDDALMDFNEVTKLSSNLQTAEARYRIAQIYYFRQAYGVAEQLCLNVNKENANYPDWVARSIILLSDIHVAKNDLFNARAALEAIIENYQGDPSILEEANQKLLIIKSKEADKSRLSPEASKSSKLQLIENNQ